MMRGRRAAPLAGTLLAGALLVPAIGAADDGSTTTAEQTAPTTTAPAKPDPAPNQAPKAALYAKAPATAGDAVTFEAYASSDPDGKLVRYEWDFDGDGSYESDGKASPTLEHTYSEAGAYEVGLRVTDDDGATAEGSMSLEVVAAEQPAPSGDDEAPKAADEKPSSDSEADSGDDAGGLKAFPDTTHGQSSSSATEAAASPESADSAAASDSTTTVPVFARREATARAAASTSVTISDFKFSPATVTVNVGDTVRWTNAGPTGHSATSSSGGFDTGILSKGQGGSATFSKAGSFSYICTPHPFMKGTVVVRASGSSSGSGGSSGSSGSSGSADASGSGTTAGGAAATSSGSGLASTGANAVLFAEIGFSLLLAGGLLRLVARPRR